MKEMKTESTIIMLMAPALGVISGFLGMALVSIFCWAVFGVSGAYLLWDAVIGPRKEAIAKLPTISPQAPAPTDPVLYEALKDLI